MQDSNEFRERALAENWMALGEWLNSLVQEPSSYGFKFAEEALQAVADARGTKASSLRNQMRATDWLQSNHPEILDKKPQWLGMMQVLLLSRLEQYSSEKAKEISPKVFAGEVSQSEMARILEKVRTSRSVMGRPQAQARLTAKQRGQSFENAARAFFKENVDDIFNHQNLIVQEGKTLEPLGTDLVVYDGSELLCAIEIRGPRSRVDPSYIIDQLARAALVLRNVPEVLYVVPQDSEYNLEEMDNIREKLEIDGIKFAALPEKEWFALADLEIFEERYPEFR